MTTATTARIVTLAEKTKAQLVAAVIDLENRLTEVGAQPSSPPVDRLIIERNLLKAERDSLVKSLEDSRKAFEGKSKEYVDARMELSSMWNERHELRIRLAQAEKALDMATSDTHKTGPVNVDITLDTTEMQKRIDELLDLVEVLKNRNGNPTGQMPPAFVRGTYRFMVTSAKQGRERISLSCAGMTECIDKAERLHAKGHADIRIMETVGHVTNTGHMVIKDGYADPHTRPMNVALIAYKKLDPCPVP